MMIFQELLKSVLRSYFLGTWMSPAEDTKSASCVENCEVLEKLEREREREIWIYFQLSTAILYYTVSTTLFEVCLKWLLLIRAIIY